MRNSQPHNKRQQDTLDLRPSVGVMCFEYENITGVFAREFWLNGELSSPCCCLFICIEDVDKLLFSHNDEDCAWEQTTTQEEIDFLQADGDGEFYYPYKEYLGNQVAESISHKGHTVGKNSVAIEFSNDASLSYLPRR